MKYILIYDNQIAGTVSNPSEAPDMFQVVPTELTEDISHLYYDGTNVLLKPVQPVGNWYWDTNTCTWIEVVNITPEALVPLTQHEMAPVLYNILAEVHPAIAECLTYLLADKGGDTGTSELMFQRLLERCQDGR